MIPAFAHVDVTPCLIGGDQPEVVSYWSRRFVLDLSWLPLVFRELPASVVILA